MTGHNHLVAHLEFASLHEELAYAEARVVTAPFGGVLLDARGRRAVLRTPLPQALAHIVSVPEPAVEHLAETFVPAPDQSIGIGSVAYGLQGLGVAAHRLEHIFRTAGASFDLEHAYAGSHHLRKEMNGFQVLGTHNVLILDIELLAGFAVADRIGPAADLVAGAAVGRGIHLVKRQIAFTTDGHAERAVAEHLDTHGPAVGPEYRIFLDMAVNFSDLRHVEFARQHHDVSPPGIESHGLGVGDIALRGDMHGHARVGAVADRGDIGGDDC